MREKATYSPQNYMYVAFVLIKKIVPIKSYATFKSSKFATLPQDLPSLLMGNIQNFVYYTTRKTQIVLFSKP